MSEFTEDFPDAGVRQGRDTPRESTRKAENLALRRWSLTRMTQEDPAFARFGQIFQNPAGSDSGSRMELWAAVEEADAAMEHREPENTTPLATLWRPVQAAPHSVKDQLIYILTRWGAILGEWIAAVPGILDMMEEETRPRLHGPGPARGPNYSGLDGAARFSRDDDWMPRVVLITKNTLVWLDQLSRQYRRHIHRLDEIPDEELDILASRGFNALWLIGLWERSRASREIKQRMGNPEAAASAYALFGYAVAAELGGWDALENLRHRAAERGIRLSSDMVPNHVGIDSDWVRHHPERLLSVPECPFPGYTFHGPDLSDYASAEVRLEDHYWDRSDAAVVFQRRDAATGAVRYIYHGNDGTSMPWNDTAQIDFLNPEAREAVMRDILHVARNFPIIRFDAAMVLARKHIRRLWFPSPGEGGAIPSRSEHAMAEDAFNAALPREFWREVVDRLAAEAPGTLLLAEAFWMMEGCFVRSLGMHRVYNSAFMNMLRDQENAKYRGIIKETLLFDPGILQRFVNFMNNPDEETAVEQFGKDDRYFAVCTLLTTLPGLPMLGHGQIEGLSEKYGMEYTRAYRDEHPDPELIARHEREIFPLMKQRDLFAQAASFRIYDLHGPAGVIESVYAYTNRAGPRRSLIMVNNACERAGGTIHYAAPVAREEDEPLRESLASALVPGGVSDDAWLLMRDRIAGLWYIRSVAELRSGGLKIEIDGFGRQVFLEFRVISDDADGAWAFLADELAGRGIDNPDAAVAEILLRPARHALDTLLSFETMMRMADSVRRGRIPDWPEDADAAGAALETLRAAGAVLPADPRKVFDAVRDRLRRAASLYRPFGCFHRCFLRRISANSGGDDALFLTAWSVLSMTAPPNVKPVSMPEYMDTALALPRWVDAVRLPNQALARLFTSDAVRRACGVNTWDDVLWYTLEGWNAFGRVVGLCACTLPVRRGPVRRMMRRWVRAHRKSGYRLDRLLSSVR